MHYLLPLLVLAACAARPAESTVATAERDAVLDSSEGAIGGLIRDAADGLALSMVTIQAEQDGRVVAHDISDYKGRYRLGPLPPGHYRVTARFASARVVYEGVVVHEAIETEVRVAIDLRRHTDRSQTVQTEGEWGVIQGVVLDGVDGREVPGAVVSLSGAILEDSLMALANEEGEFRFRSLRPGIYTLSCFYQLVEQGNIEVRRGNIVVAPGETTDVQLKLDLDIR